MSRSRRLLRWVVGLSVLCALGGFVYHFVRHKPRCVITGPLAIKHLSADGSRLVTVNQPDQSDHRIRGPVQVWDTRSGQLLRQGLGETDIWIMAMSPDGKHAAALPYDGPLRLFDCCSGEVHSIKLDTPIQGDITFSRTGRWLCLDGHLVVDAEQHRLAQILKGSLLCFNSDDRGVFLERELEDELSVIDLRTGDNIATAALGSRYHLASPDGASLLVWGGDGKPASKQLHPNEKLPLEVWDLRNLEQRFRWKAPVVSPNSQAVFSSDSRTAAFWETDASAVEVQFFDTLQGRALASVRVVAKNADLYEIRDVPGTESVWACLYDEGDETYVVLMDTTTGRIIDKRGHDGWRLHVANGALLEWDPAEDAPRLQILDARTGVYRGKTPSGYSAYVVQVTPDGRYILVRMLGTGVRRREAFFWEEWLEERWPEHFRPPLDTAVVIETATGRQRFSTPVHAVFGDVLSHDGDTLLTTDWAFSDEKTAAIKVWDVPPTRGLVLGGRRSDGRGHRLDVSETNPTQANHCSSSLLAKRPSP